MLKRLYVALEKLEILDEFKKFKESNKNSYLVSAFFMMGHDGLEKANWQVDFYSPEKHKISSFTLVDNNLEVKADQDVFQKDKQTLQELKLGDVKVDFEDVMKKIDEIKAEKYSGESPNKIIVLLQIINDVLVWNITYLTNTFNVWNIKIKASDGELISEKMDSIISFKA